MTHSTLLFIKIILYFINKEIFKLFKSKPFDIFDIIKNENFIIFLQIQKNLSFLQCKQYDTFNFIYIKTILYFWK